MRDTSETLDEDQVRPEILGPFVIGGAVRSCGASSEPKALRERYTSSYGKFTRVIGLRGALRRIDLGPWSPRVCAQILGIQMHEATLLTQSRRRNSRGRG